MKPLKTLTAAIILLVSTAAWSEETVNAEKPAKKDNPPKVLLNMSDSTFSGYGGLYTRFSKAGNTNGCYAGARGGLIINDSFVLGAAGMGLANPIDREKVSGEAYTGIYDVVQFGYGGFLTEYYFNPKDLIVLSAGTLIGGGGLSFTQDNDDDDSDAHDGSDSFFVIEPEVNVFINITRFCRIGIGASYRYVNGIQTDSFSDKDFSGPTASAMAQFGWF